MIKENEENDELKTAKDVANIRLAVFLGCLAAMIYIVFIWLNA